MQVPSLNDIPMHYLKPNSLVKFRCFIQDMFDPEFYMGVYETVDPATQAKVRTSLSSRLLLLVRVQPFDNLLAVFIFHPLFLSILSQTLRCGKYKDVTECGVSLFKDSFALDGSF